MAGLIGRQLGQYTIIATLGSGNMATVYRAHQLSMGYDVAVKVIKTELVGDDSFIRRFKQEAQTAAKLQHPHILRVFGFGTEGDLLYLVMELKKRTLAERLEKEGRLSAEEVARFLDQIGAALDYAHSSGAIHRDLKPHNVLLDEQNNAFLSDFGIARLVSALAQTTAMSGTPAYRAPEQWEGKEVDKRTDIYALAVMTYQLLTSSLPFEGDAATLRQKHLNEQPPPIRRLRPDLPEKVEAVLQKGMAKRPEDRFQSASAFAKAFREALDKGNRRLHKLSRVQNVLVGLSVLAVLVLLAMIASSSLNQPPVSEQPSETPTAPTIQVADVPTDASTFTATATLTDTPTAINTATLMSSYTFTPQPTLPPELAAQATVFAQATSAAQTAAPTLTQAAQQTADAARIATGTAYQATLEANLTAVVQTLVATVGAGIASNTPSMATSTESSFLIVYILAISALVSIVVYMIILAVFPNKRKQRLTGHAGTVWSVVWSPDGRYLASGAGDNRVHVWNAETGRLLRKFTGHTRSVVSLAWSPDGRYLASGSDDNTVRVWEASTGQLQRTLTGHTNWVNSVAWSPDGRYLASGSKDRTVCVWKFETGQRVQVIAEIAGTDEVNSVAWSPDGRFLASGADLTICVWEVQTGRCVRTLIGHGNVVSSVAWSPDGQYVASASRDRTVRVWEAATGQLLETLEERMGEVYSVAWSPDSIYLASGSADHKIRVWEASTGKLLQTLKGHANSIRSVVWSPDGRYLASASSDRTIRIWGVPAR